MSWFMEVKTMPSESDFQDFAAWMEDHGLTAEAHQDAKGRVCGLRFYASGGAVRGDARDA